MPLAALATLGWHRSPPTDMISDESQMISKACKDLQGRRWGRAQGGQGSARAPESVGQVVGRSGAVATTEGLEICSRLQLQKEVFG